MPTISFPPVEEASSQNPNAIIPIVPARIARAVNLPDGSPKLDGDYINVMALIDTGASACCVSRKIIDSAGLISVTEAKEYVPWSGERTVSIYGVAVQIPGLGLSVFQLASESAPQDRWDIIVGRKLLRRCVFTYNGPLNGFTLSFDPS